MIGQRKDAVGTVAADSKRFFKRFIALRWFFRVEKEKRTVSRRVIAVQKLSVGLKHLFYFQGWVET